MANTILHYYQPTSQSDSLPVPHGPLARVIPSTAIESANREVQTVLDEAKSRKRGPYRKYSPKERAEIGKFAVENGVLAAARKYSKVFGKPINESTVHQFKQMDRTRLAEYGGPATLSRGWAKSLLQRMKFCRRMCTTQAQMSPERVDELKLEFLQNIVDVVWMEEIPATLLFNWDQTGLNLVPASSWTMEHRGTKRVGIKGFKVKRMITGVFCCSAMGEFLPIQLIYSGKTDRCHPPQPFPIDWSITHNEKHWSNEETTLQYISDIIVPYVTRVRNDMGVGKEQAALAIFDKFKGQLTENVVHALEEQNIQSVLVPAGCTDQLQPLDLTVNRVAKSFLQQEFRQWYADEIANQYCDDDTSPDSIEFDPVDLSTARMKSIGVKWLVRLYEHFCDNPQHAVNGFLAANILQSIQAGKPVLSSVAQQIDGGDDTEDDDYSSRESDDESSEDDDDTSSDFDDMYEHS